MTRSVHAVRYGGYPGLCFSSVRTDFCGPHVAAHPCGLCPCAPSVYGPSSLPTPGRFIAVSTVLSGRARHVDTALPLPSSRSHLAFPLLLLNRQACSCRRSAVRALSFHPRAQVKCRICRALRPPILALTNLSGFFKALKIMCSFSLVCRFCNFPFLP